MGPIGVISMEGSLPMLSKWDYPLEPSFSLLTHPGAAGFDLLLCQIY